jgi:hypothetical protein
MALVAVIDIDNTGDIVPAMNARRGDRKWEPRITHGIITALDDSMVR